MELQHWTATGYERFTDKLTGKVFSLYVESMDDAKDELARLIKARNKYYSLGLPNNERVYSGRKYYVLTHSKEA